MIIMATMVIMTNGNGDKNYSQSKNKGLWMIGPEAGQFNGGLAHRFTQCR